MTPGDILLFYNPHGKARLISLFTRSPFYHVAIAASDEALIEAVPNGVVQSTLDSKRKERFVVISAPATAGRAALEWARTKIGDGYDPRDLIAIALDRIFFHLHLNYARGDRFTCGEFVATAFQKAGQHLIPDVEPEDVVPADFERLLPEGARATLDRQPIPLS